MTSPHKRITYAEYRSFGHTRWTSFVLSTPLWVLLIFAVVCGLFIAHGFIMTPVGLMCRQRRGSTSDTGADIGKEPTS